MGNTTSAHKQFKPQIQNAPPAYENCNTTVKIPTLTRTPIKLKDLKREELEFEQEQKKAYDKNYAKMCDNIIEEINNILLNRNKTKIHVFFDLYIADTTKYIPQKYITPKLTKLYFENYCNFICEMYKDFKFDATKQSGHLKLIFHIPE
jgi:hypothetical protein